MSCLLKKILGSKQQNPQYAYCPNCDKQVDSHKNCHICKMPTIQVIEYTDFFEIKPPSRNNFMLEKFSPEEMGSWYDAANYAKNLRKGGFSDWRLPTTEELLTIYKVKEICRITHNGWLWSSEDSTNNPNEAKYLDLVSGQISEYEKSDSLYVCCVR